MQVSIYGKKQTFKKERGSLVILSRTLFFNLVLRTYDQSYNRNTFHPLFDQSLSVQESLLVIHWLRQYGAIEDYH